MPKPLTPEKISDLLCELAAKLADAAGVESLDLTLAVRPGPKVAIEVVEHHGRPDVDPEALRDILEAMDADDPDRALEVLLSEPEPETAPETIAAMARTLREDLQRLVSSAGQSSEVRDRIETLCTVADRLRGLLAIDRARRVDFLPHALDIAEEMAGIIRQARKDRGRER